MVSKQWSSPLSYLYTETFCFVLEVKSLGILLCEAECWSFVHEAALDLDETTDRLRGWLDASPDHRPTVTLHPSVLKQQCPSCPPQIVWSAEDRGVNSPRPLANSHLYVPWTHITSTD